MIRRKKTVSEESEPLLGNDYSRGGLNFIALLTANIAGRGLPEDQKYFNSLLGSLSAIELREVLIPALMYSENFFILHCKEIDDDPQSLIERLGQHYAVARDYEAEPDKDA